MITQQQALEHLTEVSKGWKIENWEYRSEGFSLTIKKDEEKKILHVIATDLGMELDTCSTINSDGKEFETDLYKMAHEIIDHCNNIHNTHDLDKIPDIIEISDNAQQLSFTFMCKECGVKWHITLGNIRNSSNIRMKESMKLPDRRKNGEIFSWDCLYGPADSVINPQNNTKE